MGGGGHVAGGWGSRQQGGWWQAARRPGEGSAGEGGWPQWGGGGRGEVSFHSSYYLPDFLYLEGVLHLVMHITQILGDKILYFNFNTVLNVYTYFRYKL